MAREAQKTSIGGNVCCLRLQIEPQRNYHRGIQRSRARERVNWFGRSWETGSKQLGMRLEFRRTAGSRNRNRSMRAACLHVFVPAWHRRRYQAWKRRCYESEVMVVILERHWWKTENQGDNRSWRDLTCFSNSAACTPLYIFEINPPSFGTKNVPQGGTFSCYTRLLIGFIHLLFSSASVGIDLISIYIFFLVNFFFD